MSNALTVTRFASGADVRAWGLENGFNVADTRGRLPFELVKAYNKANAVKYVPGKAVVTKSVEVRDSRGRKVTRKVNVGQARKLLAANGVQTGARGRLSLAQLTQAWELGANSKAAEKTPEAAE